MDNYRKIIDINNKLGIDALLISNGNNMRYVSGFSGETGYLYISKVRHAVITDFRYTYQAEMEAGGYEVITLGNNGYEEAINDMLLTDKVDRLGFEANDLLHSKFLDLKEKLTINELVPIDNEVTSLRRIKSHNELKFIEQAEAIGDAVFSEILSFIKPGMTELSIAARIEYLLKLKGGENISFPAIVASGVNSSMPHAVPTHKKIEVGDFLTMDFGCVYNGYCSDMTRTIVIGKASDKQKEIYGLVLEAQLAALDFIKAGLEGRQVDKIARDIIYNAGYEGCFGHGLGHSVGLFIHEEPRLSPREEEVLLPGMVETVEPGIYVRGFGGVRIEDLVEVTREGCINYSKSNKELLEL